ncbi:hypothetical protein HOY80DRAFT_899530 [Tuber brumale]|nr:hypothetical protein HOY80DRAFT_899530 [Tuber brumale]
MGSTTSTVRASTVIFLVLAPQALAADGVDFSNNLFTDLAPVLALFGEQVAKQFLSQSLSWLEDVIFAMAPLGIITAIVSAIRVGGPNWLKAVVGRARESRAVAEVELMSSTSHEVCELWNGEAIVRVMGSPKVAELLYFPLEADGSRFSTLEVAKENGTLRNAKKKDSSTHAKENASKRVSLAPNISLNFCEAKKPGELWLFAILGIVLQFGCLIFIGVTRYHPKINLKEDQNSEYAYPLMASGTLVLVIGMMACSHVVQASSKENMWVAKNNFRILWLQKSARVNDQLFGSYAIFGDRERNKLITSRRRPHTSPRTSTHAKRALDIALSLSNLAIAGSFVSISGFVIQFVGIRALHWSASITQLVVTLAMTAVRTWIRRNISARPRSMILPVDYELDWLAVKFGTCPDKLWGQGKPHPEHNGSEGARHGNHSWEVITFHGYLGSEAARDSHTAPIRDAQMILCFRKDLGYLTGWKGASYPFALELVGCLQSLLSHVMTSEYITLVNDFAHSGDFSWALPVKFDGTEQCITMTAKRPKDRRENEHPWNLDVFELCAVISLWCYRMKQKGQALEDTPDTHRSFWHHGAEAQTVLRVLGPATHGFIRDCGCWMDKGGKFVVVENERLRKNTIEGQVTTIEAQELSKVVTHVGPSTTKSSRECIAPDRIMGTKPTDDNECRNSLAFVTLTPLRRIYAQEILSSFLWAIVGTIDSIRGYTQSRSTTPLGDHEGMVDERPYSKLENPFFQKLAEIITDSGVTSNIQDAYALIITPFATAGKLPPSPSNVPTQDDQDEIKPIRSNPTH